MPHELARTNHSFNRIFEDPTVLLHIHFVFLLFLQENAERTVFFMYFFLGVLLDLESCNVRAFLHPQTLTLTFNNPP